MSTSDLYRMWKIHGYAPGITYGAGGVFKIKPQARQIWCQDCLSRKVVLKGSETRKLHASKEGCNKRVFAVVNLPIVKCRKCEAQKRIDIEIAEPKTRYAKGFAKGVIALLRLATVHGVVKLLVVNWGLVNSILKEYLGKRHRRNFKKLFVRNQHGSFCFGDPPPPYET